MIEQHTRAALEERQWTVSINDVSAVPHKRSLIELWKMYANGVAVTLSIYEEEGQFVLYADVGHAAAGTNRTEDGRFSTADSAVHGLIQACDRWDSTWET